jgi:hypothetical protein
MQTDLTKFNVGEIWKYKNRPGEDSSTLTILKIEKYEKGDTIIHVRIDGIKLFNPNAPGGYSNSLGHLPFSEKVISGAVTRLVGQAEVLPDFQDGYNQWRAAWDSGKAGYWTLDPAEAIQGMDSVMREKR